MNTKKPRAKRPVKNVTLLELSKNLEIQAIVGGAVPRVYLLDRRTQQTHNVAVGMVIGDIEIREIRDHGVTLGWKKETLELSM